MTTDANEATRFARRTYAFVGAVIAIGLVAWLVFTQGGL